MLWWEVQWNYLIYSCFLTVVKGEDICEGVKNDCNILVAGGTIICCPISRGELVTKSSCSAFLCLPYTKSSFFKISLENQTVEPSSGILIVMYLSYSWELHFQMKKLNHDYDTLVTHLQSFLHK